jgi:polar amino acid transport system substrate-binding protein
MSRRRHTGRLAVVVLVGLALAASSACGSTGTAPASARSAAPVAVDAGLRAQLPAKVLTTQVLRIATDASYAPMSSFGPDGRTIVGMEPDLAAALGRVLGVGVQFENDDFATLLKRVSHGEVDLAMSAITDTPEREGSVDFVNYFTAGTSIVVQRGNPAGVTDIHDLCGKWVAVEAGTTQVDLLKRTQSNCASTPIQVKTYPTNSDALVQLRTGRVAAVLNDLPPAVLLTTDARTRSQYQLASTVQYEPAPYGIAVAKSQAGLRDAVQGALQTIVASGAYVDVLTRWNVRSGAMTQITVNSGR